jgi:tetratricopeptide (TPR) repeat protein
MSIMPIQDYKGRHTNKTLGLKRGKAVLKQRTVSRKRLKVFLWIGLIALMVFLNYLVFVRLGPLGKKEITIGPIFRENTKPDTFEDWFDKGYKKYQEGDLAGAAEAYTRAIMLKPEETRPYFDRGIVYMTMGEYDKAIDDYSKVIGLRADYAEAYHNRGWAHFHKDQFDLAIQDCNEALLLNPDMVPVYLTRGMAYKAKGLLDMAKSDFQKSCELGDNSGCQEYGELSKATHDGS